MDFRTFDRGLHSIIPHIIPFWNPLEDRKALYRAQRDPHHLQELEGWEQSTSNAPTNNILYQQVYQNATLI